MQDKDKNIYSSSPCPLCNSKKKKKLEDLDIKNENPNIIEYIEKESIKFNFFYCICLERGMIFLDDSDDDILNKIYNDHFWLESEEDPNNLNAISRQFVRARQIVKMIKERGCNPKNILDIGGGLGGVGLGIVYDTKAKYSIVDRSLQARKRANKLGFNSQEDIKDYIKKGEIFDLVVMCHSLEHFVDPISMIDQIRNVTDENSYIYIEVPNAKWHGSSELCHETIWTNRLMRKFSLLMGFKDSKIWVSGSPFVKSNNVYLHLLSRVGSGKVTLNLRSKIDVLFSRLHRMNYFTYKKYNSVIEKIPSTTMKNIFPFISRKRYIPDLNQNYIIVKKLIDSIQ